MSGFSKGDLDYNSGKGSVDAKTAGLYGTYIMPNGFYADLVLKYMWMTNDFDVLALQGNRVTGGDMDTSGFGASLEVDKRFHFGKNNEGFHLEPQLQLSYLGQNGGDFLALNGLKVEVDSYTSLLVRFSVLGGCEIKNGNMPFNVYAKVFGVHEFDGDIGAKFNGIQVHDSFGDTWVVYSLGVTAQFYKMHNLYLDVERSDGGQFASLWNVKLGYRILF